jgi:two-component system, sensor histidine kinase and response regulator
MIDATKSMVGSYNYYLVALSVLIAIFASYAALELAARTTAAADRIRLLWLSGGAVAMGIGIWSMHYIGMLAFSLPVPVLYDWPTVLLSLTAAIFASGVALFVVSRREMRWSQALSGGAIMGGGIATMHYTGLGGTRGMAERVRQLGGTLEITSGTQGTVVVAKLPVSSTSSVAAA